MVSHNRPLGDGCRWDRDDEPKRTDVTTPTSRYTTRMPTTTTTTRTTKTTAARPPKAKVIAPGKGGGGGGAKTTTASGGGGGGGVVIAPPSSIRPNVVYDSDLKGRYSPTEETFRKPNELLDALPENQRDQVRETIVAISKTAIEPRAGKQNPYGPYQYSEIGGTRGASERRFGTHSSAVLAVQMPQRTSWRRLFLSTKTLMMR